MEVNGQNEAHSTEVYQVNSLFPYTKITVFLCIITLELWVFLNSDTCAVHIPQFALFLPPALTTAN